MIEVLYSEAMVMDTKNKVRYPLSPAFLVFFLSFLSNEMMNKAMCHPKHGDSFIQATILEQPFRVYRKESATSFFLYSTGTATTAGSKGVHTIRKEKEKGVGSQLSEEPDDYAVLLLFCCS
jgi:hypothetical protein